MPCQSLESSGAAHGGAGAGAGAGFYVPYIFETLNSLTPLN